MLEVAEIGCRDNIPEVQVCSSNCFFYYLPIVCRSVCRSVCRIVCGSVCQLFVALLASCLSQ
jgi:hypothetical protein